MFAADTFVDRRRAYPMKIGRLQPETMQLDRGERIALIVEGERPEPQSWGGPESELHKLY